MDSQALSHLVAAPTPLLWGNFAVSDCLLLQRWEAEISACLLFQCKRSNESLSFKDRLVLKSWFPLSFHQFSNILCSYVHFSEMSPSKCCSNITLIISDNNTLICCQAATCSAGKTGMIVLKLEIYNDLNIIKNITHSQFWRTFILGVSFCHECGRLNFVVQILWKDYLGPNENFKVSFPL